MQDSTSNEYQQGRVETGGGFSSLKDPKLLETYGKNPAYLKGRNLKSLLPTTFAAPTVI